MGGWDSIATFGCDSTFCGPDCSQAFSMNFNRRINLLGLAIVQLMRISKATFINLPHPVTAADLLQSMSQASGFIPVTLGIRFTKDQHCFAVSVTKQLKKHRSAGPFLSFFLSTLWLSTFQITSKSSFKLVQAII
ncbi:hypothetical protein VP01_3428g4 [Puccinia sorghi]|uniref:Uncharacterized protein n=1 Tax=Puccinia sorghi TaxID=27349 RepID=A0A0L6UXC0_9BASI|nr:hypothetical protein VP01_3428g4 [Puccinia sorghi]